MIVKIISLASLFSLAGIACSLIFKKTSYADFFGILTFCFYALLVVVTVVQWFFRKET